MLNTKQGSSLHPFNNLQYAQPSFDFVNQNFASQFLTRVISYQSSDSNVRMLFNESLFTNGYIYIRSYNLHGCHMMK